MWHTPAVLAHFFLPDLQAPVIYLKGSFHIHPFLPTTALHDQDEPRCACPVSPAPTLPQMGLTVTRVGGKPVRGDEASGHIQGRSCKGNTAPSSPKLRAASPGW